MGLVALDLGLRGAASGVFLLMVLVLLRLRPTNRNIMLGMAMAAGGVAFAIAPDEPHVGYALTLEELQPVLAGNLAQQVGTGPCVG